MYLVKITLGRLGRRQSLKILGIVSLTIPFFIHKGDLYAQEVHTLVRGASGLQRGHLFSRVINEEEENSGWHHLLRLNDEIKNPGRAIYARAVFSRRISRKKKSSFKYYLLLFNSCSHYFMYLYLF